MKVFAVLSALTCVAARLELRAIRPETPLAIPANVRSGKGTISFTRTVNKDDTAWATASYAITPAGTCKSKDQYGGNDCTLAWGSTYGLSFDVELEKPLDKSASFTLDLKLDGLIPFKATCAVCGQDCTLKVPIIGKTIVIPLGQVPCPISAAGLKNAIQIPLPATDPIPLKVSVAGTVTLNDGEEIAGLTVKGTISNT